MPVEVLELQGHFAFDFDSETAGAKGQFALSCLVFPLGDFEFDMLEFASFSVK